MGGIVKKRANYRQIVTQLLIGSQMVTRGKHDYKQIREKFQQEIKLLKIL